VPRACSNFIRGRIQSGDNLDRVEWTAQASLHIGKAQSEAELYGRFMGGSDRNTSNPGRVGQSAQYMQFVQHRINAGDCTSR